MHYLGAAGTWVFRDEGKRDSGVPFPLGVVTARPVRNGITGPSGPSLSSIIAKI